MIIGVLGSSDYDNKLKILNFIAKLKQNYPHNLQIVSGGNELGAERIVKKCCLKLQLPYIEFNFPFTPKNSYSYPFQKYGCRYNVGHIHNRNRKIVEYCDKFIIFCNDVDHDSVSGYLNEISKLNKKYVIVK